MSFLYLIAYKIPQIYPVQYLKMHSRTLDCKTGVFKSLTMSKSVKAKSQKTFLNTISAGTGLNDSYDWCHN